MNNIPETGNHLLQRKQHSDQEVYAREVFHHRNGKEEIMKMSKLILSCFAGTMLSLSGMIWAADAGSITILSPKAGSSLQSGVETKLEYNLHLSPEGSHLHVYVDDGDPIVVRKVSNCPCSMTLPPLSPGKHTIVIKEAKASHSLTGVEGSVAVTAK